MNERKLCLATHMVLSTKIFPFQGDGKDTYIYICCGLNLMYFLCQDINEFYDSQVTVNCTSRKFQIKEKNFQADNCFFQRLRDCDQQ